MKLQITGSLLQDRSRMYHDSDDRQLRLIYL